MTKPDFKEWAKNIVILACEHGTALEDIETALKQSFDQGYSLGLNQGWAIEQDACKCGKPTCFICAMGKL